MSKLVLKELGENSTGMFNGEYAGEFNGKAFKMLIEDNGYKFTLLSGDLDEDEFGDVCDNIFFGRYTLEGEEEI